MFFIVVANDKLELNFDISTLKINKGDIIILTFDKNYWDVNQVEKLVKYFSKEFHDNKVIAKLKGVEIEVKNENINSL